ncbi:MAG: MATE family efflux transporter [Oscillospiraceae bacterium]|nr:MATE family efflux transporter [Oscillospiraceae bacterium]
MSKRIGLNQSSENKEFYRSLIVVGIPVVIQNLLNSSLNLIDTVMVGRLGEQSVAAVGAANQLFFILNCIMVGIAGGCGIFISQYNGKNDLRRMRHSLGISLMLSFSFGTLFFLAAFLIPEQIAWLFIEEKGFIHETASYLRIVSFSYPITAVTVSYATSLRNTGRSVQAMVTSAIGIAVNIALNYILIFGRLGFPAMGIEGAALATLIARIVEMAVILLLVYGRKTIFSVSPAQLFSFEKEFLFRVAKPITHTVGDELIWAAGLVTYTIAYGKLGETALAVAQIYSVLQKFLDVLFYGIASAAIVIIGQQIGKGHMERAKQYGKKMIVLTSFIAVALSATMFFGAPLFAGLFSLSEGTSQLVITTLRMVSIPFIGFGINTVVLTGILRSGGDTKVPMLIDGGLIWFVGVPMALLGCVVFKWPIYTVLTIVEFVEVMKATVFTIRFLRGNWISDMTKAQS